MQHASYTSIMHFFQLSSFPELQLKQFRTTDLHLSSLFCITNYQVRKLKYWEMPSRAPYPAQPPRALSFQDFYISLLYIIVGKILFDEQ